MFSKFTFTATVTEATGKTRTETGTVEAFGGSKARARTEAANKVSSGKPGERVDVDVRHAS